MTIDDYIDAAITARRFSSARELSTALGMSPVLVSAWRTKRAWPSDETMLTLAELAGLDAKAALLDLNTWRAKSGKAKAQYQAIRAAILGSLAALVLLPLAVAQAGNNLAAALPVLYIMRYRGRACRAVMLSLYGLFRSVSLPLFPRAAA